VVARKLSKSYERPLFHDFSMRVTRGQRIAILGPNASGKSTLLKMIAGLVRPDEGEIRIGKGVVMGYFPQEHEGLPDNTVLDHLRRTVPLDITSLRRELHHYQLTEDEVWTNVRCLSAGERARLLLLQFALSHANLLLLDEPTNSLDPDMRSTLADSLAQYGGSVLVVSHDHSFLERLSVDRILRLGDGAIRVEYGQEL
jgi:ATP-binding cassette subfamily F protein 3